MGSSDWCFSDGLYTNNANKCSQIHNICSGLFSRNVSRKLAYAIAALVPGVLMVLCGYLENKIAIIVLIVASATIMPLATGSFMANMIDVSPTKSNVMYGISNTLATLPGVVAPILDGWIL